MSPAAARRPAPATTTGRADKYIHVTAKDSDSDSCIEDGEGCISNSIEAGEGCIGARTAAGGASSAREIHEIHEIRTITKLPAVPDLHGVRYCRVCRDFLPVSRFPRGVRRFTCRVHLWQRNGQKARKALLMKPRKRLLARLWMQGYKDSFKLGHARIALTQKELDALLDAYACSEGCSDGHGEAEPRAAGAAERLDKLAVVPIDRAKLLCMDNAAVVTKEERSELLAMARRRGLR